MILLRELSEKSGVSRRSIQGYEEMNLIGPDGRNKYGHLLYQERTIEKVKEIRFLQDIGLSLKEVRDYLWLPREGQKDWLRKQLIFLENEKTKYESLIKKTMELLKEE